MKKTFVYEVISKLLIRINLMMGYLQWLELSQIFFGGVLLVLCNRLI